MKTTTLPNSLLSLLAAASVLLPVSAHADEVSQSIAPPPAPSEMRPVRSARHVALMGDIGWNSLTGLGVVVTGNVTKNFALDLGAGSGLGGGKLGLRARYNILDTVVTPFVAAGATQTFGLRNAVELGNGRQQEHFDVAPSTSLQGLVGMDYTSRSGFMMLLYGGYSYALGGSPLKGTSSTQPDTFKAFQSIYGGGAVFGASFGYAFGG